MTTPTESEIQQYAKRIFPINKELQASFIEGAWLTIYTMKIKSNNK